jgi:predicted amino acid racemase
VVSVNGDSCVVETSSHRLINVNNCMSHRVGDSVTVSYRKTTSLGELTSAPMIP